VNKSAVSNSACLIALEHINRLELLALSFKKIYIPLAVHEEFGYNVDWLNVTPLKNYTVAASLKTQLGKGEAEAIALAMEIEIQ
jgi:predicted nucleic acid-binding protein